MTIYVIETHGSRNLDGNEQDTNKETSERGYIVTGTEDEYAAYVAVQAAAPAFDVSLIRNTIKLKHIEVEHWEATVQYVVPEREKKDPDIGQIEWDFDTTGGTQHITSSRQTSEVFKRAGFDTIHFQQAINVCKKKHGYDVKGVDVVVPRLELTCTTSFAPNVVTIEWIKGIAEMTGKTNDAVWKTFERGELLFMGARIKTKYREKTTVVFNFSASERITAADNVTIGGNVPGLGQAGLGPIEKNGHEYLWVYFEQEDVEDRVLMSPVQVNVEQIYTEANFSELGIGN